MRAQKGEHHGIQKIRQYHRGADRPRRRDFGGRKGDRRGRAHSVGQRQRLGATNDFTVGVYNVDEKQYHANDFKGNFEIVSLTGTINTMDGEFYTHLHMSAGDEKGQVFGGHLNRAVVSAVCEMVITVIDGVVDRRFSEEIGLNLFRF
jgi:predicted DNA-binding protein with PD1-like motif